MDIFIHIWWSWDKDTHSTVCSRMADSKCPGWCWIVSYSSWLDLPPCLWNKVPWKTSFLTWECQESWDGGGYLVSFQNTPLVPLQLALIEVWLNVWLARWILTKAFQVWPASRHSNKNTHMKISSLTLEGGVLWNPPTWDLLCSSTLLPLK